MSKNEAEWITWVCESLARGCKLEEIISTLQAQGHPQANGFVQRIMQDPIYKWGLSHANYNYDRWTRLNSFHRLMQDLDRHGSHEIPVLFYPNDQAQLALFYQSNQACIIKSWASHWQAFNKPWSPQRFLEDFASVELEVTEGRESLRDFDPKASLLKKQTTLGSFAQQVIECDTASNDFYIIARNHAFKHQKLASLLDEIDEQPFLNPQYKYEQSALWFGPKGTFTPLHHDTCNIMFVQMWGKKRIDLLPPHRLDLFDHSLNMYAQLDLRQKSQIEQRTVYLEAGDALFIPVGWWHQVEALSASTSLAMTHFVYHNHYQWYQPGHRSPIHYEK